MIELIGVTKSFGNNHVLRGVDLTVALEQVNQSQSSLSLVWSHLKQGK